MSENVDVSEDFRRALTPRSNKYLGGLNPPHPKQIVGMLAPHREVLFGGAAGGGKSDWLLRSALQYVDVPGYNALILRTTVQSLTLAGGLIPRSMEWLQDTDAKWDAQSKTWFFPSGARLTFGYLQTDKDMYKYASSEWHFIGFEELTEFPREEQYTFLFSRMRRPQGGELGKVPLRMRATTNPIGVGLAWVRNRFVPDGVPINTKSRFFLPSGLEDNPSINLEEYDEALQNLGPDTYKKLRYGDWSEMDAGYLFPRSAAQIIPVELVPRRMYTSVRAWDLAGSIETPQNSDPDWSVGLLLQRHRKDAPEVYIRNVRRFRATPDVTEQNVIQMTRADGRGVYIRSEQEPGQSGKAQVYHYKKLLRGYKYEGAPATKGKKTRASPASAAWLLGNIYLVDDGSGWIPAFLDELDKFDGDKNGGFHDDQVDALALAYNELEHLKPIRRGGVGPRLG